LLIRIERINRGIIRENKETFENNHSQKRITNYDAKFERISRNEGGIGSKIRYILYVLLKIIVV